MEMHEDAQARRRLELQCKILEIDNQGVTWQREQFRKLLLEQVGAEGNAGQSAPQSRLQWPQPESGQPVSSLSPLVTPSGPSPQRQQVPPRARQDDSAIPPSPTPQRHQVQPSARQEDIDRGRHRRISATFELVPPMIVGRRGINPRLENRELFVPGTIAALCANNSPENRSAIFSAAGLRNHHLTALEAAWSRKTPTIPWVTFARVFGHVMYAERPMAARIRAYKGSFICTTNTTQPFAPRGVGEPGVILFPPDAVLLEDTRDTFHVLIDPSAGYRTRLLYCGIYTKVRTRHIMEVQPDEWHALPTRCRTQWLKRLWNKGAAGAARIHARCTLRVRLDSEPSLAEVEEFVGKCRNRSDTPNKRAIPNGFNAGIEKLRFEAIICVGYDMKLAKLIRDETDRRRSLDS